MGNIKTFYDLEVWQKGHRLVLHVYRVVASYPPYELFGLTSQSRRASISVPANIVEGFRRKSLKESIHFYTIADASLEELKYHLLLARDLGYISKKTLEESKILTEDVGRHLARWIQSQKKYIP